MAFGIKNEFKGSLENKQEEPAAQPATPPAAPATNDEVNTDPAAPVNTEANTAQPATEPAQPAAPIEITDDAVLEYLRSQKKLEVNSFEDLLKKPEPVKEVVNPYADLEQVEDVKNFLDYVKETGRGMNDFLKLREDIDSMSALDLARQRVKDELGRSDISIQQIDKILEKRLNVDLTDITELDETDALEIEAYAKPVRDARKADKEKYLKPLEKQPAAPNEEMVTLQDGQQVPKSQYEQMVARQNYLEALKSTVNSVADDTIKMNVGDTENPLELSVSYEYSQEDRHSMLSMASDVEETVKRLFTTENGLDHARFQKAVWRLDEKNWEKTIISIAQKVRAETVQEFLKDEHNVNFNRNRMPGSTAPKPTAANIFDKPGFGVKYPI